MNIPSIPKPPKSMQPVLEITPGQKRILDLPQVQELLKALDCEVQPSPEYRMNKAIANRVDQMITEFEKPKKPRQIFSDSPFKTDEEIKKYLENNKDPF